MSNRCLYSSGTPPVFCAVRRLTVTRAVELANSVFQLRITKMYRFHASLVAKTTAAILPAAQMVLLRYSGVDKSTVGFMALADAISASLPSPPYTS